MDWLTKQKTYVWLIIILVIINLTTLVLLWNGRHGGPPQQPGKNDHPDTNKFLQKELGLSNEQEKQFQQIRQNLFDSTNSFNENIRLKKTEIQREAFKDNPDAEKVNTLLNEIGDLQSKNERFMFKHFSELKKILTQEQMVKFNKVLDGFGKNKPNPKMGEGMRPDGERQGPPPSPQDEFPPPGQ